MFDRQGQPWQYSIITDYGGGGTVMVCQLAVPKVWWLLWGTADTKSKSSTRAGGGQWSQMTSA